MIPTSLLILGALAALARLLGPRLAGWAGVLVAAVPFGLGCWYASAAGSVAGGASVIDARPWVPDLGVTLSFRLDGLSLLFALLICFIGSLVLLYASSYLRSNERIGSFFATLIGFMAAMLGLVTAENLILIFVFWELTSITSFMLIGFDDHRAGARKAAVQALIITGVGGLALLAGLILLGLAAGGFEVADLLGADLPASDLYAPGAVLVLLGAFTKSAIVPFHLWLPNAMEAPSPVSALLHSATMVKAGVYLIARLHPAMGGPLLWDETLVIAGAVTMLGAGAYAVRQTQFKRILAYSTVSSLGTLVTLIGLGAEKAAATYLLAHAMFKGCLFLVAGNITSATGAKDPDALGGLLRAMPLTAGAALAGALSMAGMFPLLGFVGKELLIKAGLAHPEWATAATAVVAGAGFFTVVAALLVGARPFLGPRPDGAPEAGDPDWRRWAPPLLLGVAGLVAGVAPALFATPLVGATVPSLGGDAADPVKLGAIEYLWPPTTATFISLGVLALGLVAYLARGLWRPAAVARLEPPRWATPTGAYDAALAGTLGGAGALTRVLQNGSLQRYVRITLFAAFAAGAAALGRSGVLGDLGPVADRVTALDAMLALSLFGATVLATTQRTALASVALLGVVGFVLALVFVLYGAPDVAMTQFAVETLIVIIFVLVIFHLPRYSRLTGRLRRAADALTGAAFGLLMSALTFAALDRPAPESISAYHSSQSVPGGFGRNVVNVILVDFRALDTLVEIFVIGVAAVGVYTLLRAGGARPRGAAP